MNRSSKNLTERECLGRITTMGFQVHVAQERPGKWTIRAVRINADHEILQEIMVTDKSKLWATRAVLEAVRKLWGS